MKRLFTLILLALCGASNTHAQSSSDEYPRVEFFGGFSHNRVDTGVRVANPAFTSEIDGRAGFNGFETAITGNISRYVGLKFDFSAHSKSARVHPCALIIPCPPDTLAGELRSRLYTYVGGVQFKDNARGGRVKPFAHFLAGAATLDATFRPNPDDPNPPLCAACRGDDTGFAAVLGGGLDVPLSSRLSLRLIQVDYNPTRLGGETQHNVRLGIGLNINSTPR